MGQNYYIELSAKGSEVGCLAGYLCCSVKRWKNKRTTDLFNQFGSDSGVTINCYTAQTALLSFWLEKNEKQIKSNFP